MKKSELKKHIVEALTPDEAGKVDSKYKEIFQGMLSDNPLKLAKYDNPDAVAYGRAIKLIQKESKLNRESSLDERLTSMVREVYTKQQQQFMCAMTKPGVKRPKGLSKAEAEEMCKDTAISKKKKMEEEVTDKEEKKLKKIGKELNKSSKMHKGQADKIGKIVKEERTSSVSKARAKSELKQMLQGYRDDGMGKSTLKAVLAIDKDGKETKINKLEDFSKFETGTKFALKETTMENTKLTELIKSALKGPVKEGEDYFDHYKEDLIFKVEDKHEAFDLYKKLERYGFISDHYFSNDIRYGNTTGSDIIVFPASVNDLPNSAEKLIKIIGREPITIDGWENIKTESVNEHPIVRKGLGKAPKAKDITSKRKMKTPSGVGFSMDYSVDESFDSLVKKVDKEKGYTKKEAEKVAGAIAAKKAAGAGKGPTAKQKKRVSEDGDWIQKAIKRPGALHRELGVPKDKDIPKSLINKTLARLRKKDKDDEEEGTQLGAADERELRQLNLAKTLSKFNENKLAERILKELRG